MLEKYILQKLSFKRGCNAGRRSNVLLIHLDVFSIVTTICYVTNLIRTVLIKLSENLGKNNNKTYSIHMFHIHNTIISLNNDDKLKKKQSQNYGNTENIMTGKI